MKFLGKGYGRRKEERLLEEWARHLSSKDSRKHQCAWQVKAKNNHEARRSFNESVGQSIRLQKSSEVLDENIARTIPAVGSGASL